MNHNDNDFPEPPLSEKTLQSFTPATTNEVLIIIKKCPNKSCDLDPFPTLLLKRCVDQLIFPIITTINLSMQSGVVQRDFKHSFFCTNNRITLCSHYVRLYVTLCEQLRTIIHNVRRLFYDCSKLHYTRQGVVIIQEDIKILTGSAKSQVIYVITLCVLNGFYILLSLSVTYEIPSYPVWFIRLK